MGAWGLDAKHFINLWLAELWLLSLISEPCVHINMAGSVKSPGTWGWRGIFKVLRIFKALGLLIPSVRWPIPPIHKHVDSGLQTLCVAKSKLLHCAFKTNLIWIYHELRDQEISLSEPGKEILQDYHHGHFSHYLVGTLGKEHSQSCGFDISSRFSQAHTGPMTAAEKHRMENFRNPCTDTWKIILAGYSLLWCDKCQLVFLTMARNRCKEK